MPGVAGEDGWGHERPRERLFRKGGETGFDIGAPAANLSDDRSMPSPAPAVSRDGSVRSVPHRRTYSMPRPRVAIQISGHLKDVCRTGGYRGPIGHQRWTLLESTVKECRRVAVCDVFIATFTTMYPVASKHDSLARLQLDAAPEDMYNISFGYTRSYACLEFLERVIGGFTAITIDAQPRNVIPALGNATMYRGEWVTKSGAGHMIHLLANDTEAAKGVSPMLAGVRASVHAVAAASRLRREHCAVFGCANAHDVVVRLRPDLYEQTRLAGHRVQKDWLQYGTLPPNGWAAVAKTALAVRRAGGTAAARANTSVYSCHSGKRPADKGVDNCWWGTAEVLDRLAADEDAITVPFLRSNVCWGQWELAGSTGPQPLHECGERWVNCSKVTGCIAEDLLRVSIERIGATRRALPVYYE